VLETGQIIDAADPMERFSASLYGRLRPLCTDRWWRRFVLSVTEYLFSGSLTSMRYWRDGVIPDVDAYMRIRRLDSGMYATLDMVEVAAGIYLPDEVLFHPVVRELRRVTNEHVSFANDLFSYHKEVVRRGYPFNLLHVLMVREGLDVDEAVDRVVGLLNDHSSRFADLVLDLPSWGDELDETMRAYVEGMRCWMVGNYVFSRVSGRYTDPDWVVPELRAPLTLDEVLSPNRSSARGA